jgi:RNA-binding protein 23/39
MSGLDVEALLESTAAPSTSTAHPSTDARRSEEKDDPSKGDRHEGRRERDRSRDRDRRRRDRSRDRERRRERERGHDMDEEMKSPKSDHGSANGSHRSRRRSRSPDSERRRGRRDRHGDDRGGDYYRGGGRVRSRSRSPYDERYYRPSGRSRRDDRDDDRHHGRKESKRSSSARRQSKTPDLELNEDERDKRTIFVQQLAARLRTKELIAFFEKVGPVKEAQIVKDRVSGRSKGSVSIFP